MSMLSGFSGSLWVVAAPGEQDGRRDERDCQDSRL